VRGRTECARGREVGADMRYSRGGVQDVYLDKGTEIYIYEVDSYSKEI